MEKKIFLSVLSIVILSLLAALFLPGGRAPDPDPKLPWLITVDESGELTVFGLTLEKSTLRDARRILGDTGETVLYVKADGKKSVEVFFERQFLSGIRSNIILTLILNPHALEEIYQRGERINKAAEQGVMKVEMADEDTALLVDRPISHITYLPYIDLEEEVILGRFGEPEQRVPEESGVTHWLYPEKGLDIVVNPDGKEVIQYLPPARFDDEVLDPLLQAQEAKERAQRVTE